MVPGSTLRYGSSFWTTTGMLRDLRILPMAAVVMPLPTELTTPPVTNMYLVVPIYPLLGASPQPNRHDTGWSDRGVKRTLCPQRRKRGNPLAVSYPHSGLTTGRTPGHGGV